MAKINQKKFFFRCVFDLDTRVFELMWHNIYLCDISFLVDLIYLTPVWSDKLFDLMKEIVSITIVAMNIGKNNFLVIIAMDATRKIFFIRNMNLTDTK